MMELNIELALALAPEQPLARASEIEKRLSKSERMVEEVKGAQCVGTDHMECLRVWKYCSTFTVSLYPHVEYFLGPI